MNRNLMYDTNPMNSSLFEEKILAKTIYLVQQYFILKVHTKEKKH